MIAPSLLCAAVLALVPSASAQTVAGASAPKMPAPPDIPAVDGADVSGLVRALQAESEYMNHASAYFSRNGAAPEEVDRISASMKVADGLLEKVETALKRGIPAEPGAQRIRLVYEPANDWSQTEEIPLLRAQEAGRMSYALIDAADLLQAHRLGRSPEAREELRQNLQKVKIEILDARFKLGLAGRAGPHPVPNAAPDERTVQAVVGDARERGRKAAAKVKGFETAPGTDPGATAATPATTNRAPAAPSFSAAELAADAAKAPSARLPSRFARKAAAVPAPEPALDSEAALFQRNWETLPGEGRKRECLTMAAHVGGTCAVGADQAGSSSAGRGGPKSELCAEMRRKCAESCGIPCGSADQATAFYARNAKPR